MVTPRGYGWGVDNICSYGGGTEFFLIYLAARCIRVHKKYILREIPHVLTQVWESFDVPLCLVDRDCIELEGDVSFGKRLETWA